MKFKNLKGYVEEGSSYISIEIEGGNNDDNIGDQVWFSNDGTEMQISEYCDQDVFDEVKEMFSGDKRAFIGAMLRMGIYI